jgi:hypothetical protein
MHSLLVVMLLTIACTLFSPCVHAQNQQRWAQSSAKNQIAYKSPSASQFVSSQQNFDYTPLTQGENSAGGSNAWNNPGALNNAGDSNNAGTWNNAGASNNVAASNQSTGSWTAQQSGVAAAYNYSDPSAYQAGNASAGRTFDRSGDTYAMSQADVLAARRAILSGSFFSYHGTQSSQSTRNR